MPQLYTPRFESTKIKVKPVSFSQCEVRISLWSTKNWRWSASYALRGTCFCSPAQASPPGAASLIFAARIEHWDYKLEGWPTFRDARPNATHDTIVRLERAAKVAAVVTQNIDGLHSRAGTSADLLVELHGTNSFVECQSCAKLSAPEPAFEYFRQTRKPPRCDCGGFLKPATISFGQNLRPQDLQRAEAFAQIADLVVALGSTLSVYPAANIPLIAAGNGAPYVIINRGPTDHDGLRQVSLRIEGDVNQLFPQAVDEALEN
jgi:NAD-dependent deacetylase